MASAVPLLAYASARVNLMQLTRFSDYALRLLISLAQRPSELTTIRQVAEMHGISKEHLTKVVQRLARLGYIRTVRGKNGGIAAARSAASISIGRLIRDLEPLAPVECFLQGYAGGCRFYPGCKLRGVLHSAQAQYLGFLDAYTVADVVAPGVTDPLRAPRPRTRKGASSLPKYARK